MVRSVIRALGISAMLLWSAPGTSSGCCYEMPQWKLGTIMFSGYGNSAMLVPGNDSRVNLLLLLMDTRPAGTLKILPAPEGSARHSWGATPLFQWAPFRDSLFDDTLSAGEGSRCQSSISGAEAFVAAVNADGMVPEKERNALIAARRALEPCEGRVPGAMSTMASRNGQAFAGYLRGAQAFYAGDFAAAGPQFSQLVTANNGWIREASTYMNGRVALNLAQTAAVDNYGSILPPEKLDSAAALTAETALLGYLKAYPKGIYATSARGLLRRVYWLAGDRAKLGAEYRRLFTLSPAARGVSDADLVQEMDYKYLPQLGTGEASDPVVIAILDLMRMRGSDGGNAPDLTRAQVEAQAAAFAGNPALFGYVRAAHAYFVDKRPSDVLTLIGDEAREGSFSYLQFSRQMLRGLALDATGDRNARGFWLTMIAGATQPYQRQAVELALAMHEERSGGLDRVFQSGSAIADPSIRDILLNYSAGPDLLRHVARSPDLARRERDAALFVLLYKELGRGFYVGFLNDLQLVGADAPTDMNYLGWLNYREIDYAADTAPPLGMFRSKNLGDYGCPALVQTATALSRAPALARARLCVAEFMRVNGFDHFAADTPMPKDELGGGPAQFPGTAFSRLEVYKSVIGDPKSPASDKAYALYRAVNCYAPSGSNDCGGVEVDVGQRRAWFNRLKRDYAQTRWAKALEYYW